LILVVRDLISKFLSGQIVIISMISENEMLYEDKAMIINQIVDKIIKEAEIRYNSQQQRRINGIIVLDEAHRYAQQKMEPYLYIRLAILSSLLRSFHLLFRLLVSHSSRILLHLNGALPYSSSHTIAA